MQPIERQVLEVQKVFHEIEKERSKFMSKATLQCPQGCAICCHGRHVTATVLEFLPFAWHIYHEGKLEDIYFELKEKKTDGCVLLQHFENGGEGCSQYENRGVICRLFGNAAMTDKHGKKQFSSCAILKGQIANNNTFDDTLQHFAPVYSNYYMQLRNIDLQYGCMFIPINLAILKSLEVVYYNTRNMRKRPGRKRRA